MSCHTQPTLFLAGSQPRKPSKPSKDLCHIYTHFLTGPSGKKQVSCAETGKSCRNKAIAGRVALVNVHGWEEKPQRAEEQPGEQEAVRMASVCHNRASVTLWPITPSLHSIGECEGFSQNAWEKIRCNECLMRIAWVGSVPQHCNRREEGERNGGETVPQLK